MIDSETFVLDNGLRVVHSHDPQTAMVVVNVLYNTGSRDEQPELTGMAHLFEHLMFGGSGNIPAFDSALEMAGGTNNAATSNDFTYFYDIVPAINAETPFWLESDRMLALAFSDKALEVQRHVVIEEFKQTCLNRPYGTMAHNLFPMLYKTHPYSWPVIGVSPEHIERVTQDDVRHWFYTHYAPNNAILSVVGNITAGRTIELAEKWFESIPSREIAPRTLSDDAWPDTTVRKDIHENVPQTLVAVGFRMDPYGTREYFAADAITDILSAGKSSRYFRRLVMESDLFTSADASISGFEHSGFLLITGRINSDDDASVDKAIEMLLDQARQLAQPGNVTDYELTRAKNRYESVFTVENMNMVNKSLNLAIAEYHGENINDNVPRYRSLTTDDIARTAGRLFIDHAPAILVIRPQI
ncbi:MAG: insulinase family protein [Muribaculaceae bacterium]|nr:insulinase family protein [Muribaculaceae bacterium]